MVVVIDNSVLVPLFLEDEDSSQAVGIFSNEEARIHAPSLLHFEFGNVLLVFLRRGRLKEDEVRKALEFFNEAGIQIEGVPGHHLRELSFELAEKHQLSFYDASYLALALERGGKLATLDKKLQAAARKELASFI